MNDISKSTKRISFEMLLESVNYCNLCERLCSRKKVLSKYNGNLNSKVLFIAEAPGRLGAECTGIPLYGDKTGENFDLLLNSIGWDRNDIFITNAILCNPQDDKGNNATPNKVEILNCNYYLEMTIKLIEPDIIVTLGATALNALKLIYDHKFTLKDHVGECLQWGDKKLMPLYHTGPRALVHRSRAKQRADFISLSHMIDPKKGVKKKELRTQAKVTNLSDRLLELVKYVVGFCKDLSFFKLTKLLYLIDYYYLKDHGSSISGAVFLRMQEGPWVPSLRALVSDNADSFSTYFINKKAYVRARQISNNEKFSGGEIVFIRSILEKYSNYTDFQLKTAVYLTEPMKYILEQENTGQKMLKVPVLYKDNTVINLHVPK